MTNSRNNYRKPNYKKWICPIDGEPVNSRGAASYLRIKFGIKWDPRYMNNPELICNLTDKNYDMKLFAHLVAIVSDLKIDDLDLRDSLLEELYRFHCRICFAANKKDAKVKLKKLIYPIRSSSYRIVSINKNVS